MQGIGGKSGESSGEQMKLMQMAKYWDYTCTFCFKAFPSAQALGGHQNAHRKERMEEKKLFIKDPIGYRRRAFLRSFRPPQTHQEAPPPPSRVADMAMVMAMNNNNCINEQLCMKRTVNVGKNAVSYEGGDGINCEALDLTLKL